MTKLFPLTIFYDGSCIVCSSEIEHYRKNNPLNRLLFVDISAADFDPQLHGRELDDFMARMHVKDAHGQFFTGVDAFLLIWQAYPSGSLYRVGAAIIGLPGVKLLARGGYWLFARYRHLLPKRKDDCSSGTCNLQPPR